MTRWSREAVVTVLLLSAACGGSPPAAGDGSSAFKPVASVDQLMDAIVVPSSQALFDAVVYVNGELTQSPKTDDEWFRLRMQALAVAEAGNLLVIPPRARDGEWVRFSHAMTDAAVRVEQAADAKNLDLMLQTGGELYAACTACHEQYLMEQP
jgi:cytochrome c556